MTAAELTTYETEAERVERWRVDELMRAGYDHDSAAELAARSDVDLHRAIELIEAGCGVELALQILR
ncbi:MAG: hypothetical protein JO064_03550 [Actinobacteria bacterium]|nr:hypothetical protein [Actinomycetota bacterium]